MNAAEAAPIMARAFASVVHRAPTRRELDGLLALARLETHFGGAWTTEQGRAAHNWGAVQAGAAVDNVCPVGSFAATDTHPTSGAYLACFRAYPSNVAGAADVVRIVMRDAASRRELARGNSQAFAAAQHAAGYYEGRGATIAERITGRAEAFHGAAIANAREMRRSTSWKRGRARKPAPRASKLKLLAPLASVALAIWRGAR